MPPSFSSKKEITGVPNFGITHIDPEEVAKCFQVYLHTASKLTGVSLDDITLKVIKMPTDTSKATLTDLLEAGVKLFDAVVWITAGRPTSHPLVIDPGMKVAEIASLHNVARAVFYCYFMLVTQARYPVSHSEKQKPNIPNFLRSVMGMSEEQHVYVETVCTFEPQKFDPAWAQHVTFKGFGQEVLSRFGLGVAGYRAFGPFGKYALRPDAPENIKRAYEFARTVAVSPASWDIHPLTRKPNVLTKRGNLNKNLNNLILECFTTEEIAEMAAVKMIYDVPKKDPAHRNYMQWSSEDDITGTALIFSE